MATYTENFGLHQWVPEDDFLRTDFNTDFQKIDAALGEMAKDTDLGEVRNRVNEKCKLITGSFVGDGAESKTVRLSSRPYALAICSEQNMLATIAMRGRAMGPLNFTNDGFSTGTGGNVPQNVSGVRYQFFALA